MIHKGGPHWIVFGWAISLALLSARFVVGADLATSREATQTCLIIAGVQGARSRCNILPTSIGLGEVP